jgi:hypothetical protein
VDEEGSDERGYQSRRGAKTSFVNAGESGVSVIEGRERGEGG